MRFLWALTSILFFSPVASSAGVLHVYVCNAGKVQQQAIAPKELSPQHQNLIRTGNAYWRDGRIDPLTSIAMFTGAGIWKYAAVKDVIAKVKTSTATNVIAGVALTESGRNGRPWPWTINWRGKSLYFDHAEEAIEYANSLIASGERSFDVGMMQVNWHFHGQRFTDIRQAFDPIANITIADGIIQEHLKATGSMDEAIGRYHSKTPSRKTNYLLQVLQAIEALGHSGKTEALPTQC